MKDSGVRSITLVPFYKYGLILSHRLRSLWEWLTKPSDKDQQPDLKRQSQLLAGLLVVVVLLGVQIESLMLIFTPTEDRADWLIVPTILLLGLAFVLNRAGHFSVSAWITIVTQSLAIFVITFNTGNRPVEVDFLAFLFVPLLFAGMFLAEKFVLLLAIIYIWGIGMSPAFAPGVNLVDALIGPGSFMAIASGMIYLIIHHRNVLESDRQRELVEKEERYRTLLETNYEGICIIGDGQILDANPNFARLFGHPLSEVLGEPVSKFLPPGFQPEGSPPDQPTNSYPSTLPVHRKDGTLFYIEILSRKQAYRGQPAQVIAIRDITGQVKAQADLDKSERLYRGLFESANDAIFLIDLEDRVVAANQQAADLLGYCRDELIGKNQWEFVTPVEYSDAEGKRQALLNGQSLPICERMLHTKEGAEIPVEINTSLIRDNDGEPLFIQKIVRDITQRKKTEQALKESEARYRQLVDTTPDFIYSLDRDCRHIAVNKSVCQALGLTAAEIIGKSHRDLGFPEDVAEDWLALNKRVFDSGEVVQTVMTTPMPGGKSGTYEVVLSPIFDVEGGVVGIRGVSRDVSALKRAEQELHKVNRALQVLSHCNQALVRAIGESELLNDICRIIVDLGKYRFAWVGYAEQDLEKTVRPVAWAGVEQGYLKSVNVTWSDSERGRGPAGTAVRTRQAVIVHNVQSDPTFTPWRIDAAKRGYNSVIGLPLLDHDQALGVLTIYSGEPDAFDEEEAKLLTELAADLAYGILSLRTRGQREKAEAKIHSQLQSLAALRSIDIAITSSLDLRVIFDVLLDKITTNLNLDAACLLLFNPHTQTLEFAAGRGFRTQSLQHTHLRLGEGYAGIAALGRQTINVPDLRSRKTDFLRSPLFSSEEFVAYYAVPLIAKGHVKGVLEVFQRHILDPDREWLDFLDALAGQAAIALDNAGLFGDLQRSNVELTLAYDTTIEGWSRALDLRDHETEGHSRRVTEMTVKLARKMGMDDAELVHVRRGALLHDIGKMGIPDHILLKPGPLAEEEWETMRKHPVYAYELLSPIAYLRPALDIPYCHHEKWDGTGYPRGLRDEQIPLSARIFAVADVWDALTSDRPYRKAWSKEKTLEYILAQAGHHFDPRVVEAFIRENGGAHSAGGPAVRLRF